MPKSLATVQDLGRHPKGPAELGQLAGRPARWFLLSSAVVLAATGLAKAWSAVGPSKVLAVADPITDMQFGHLMLAVGLLELTIASVCLFSKVQKLSLALVAWLATNFVVYRLGLWWMGWHRPRGCRGNGQWPKHVAWPFDRTNTRKFAMARVALL